MQIITEIFSTIPGTTSAHAENTCAGEVFSLADENYLRVRGEYDDGLPNITAGQELPPRTRRIHPQRYRLLGGGGTTSAYAENTCLILIGCHPLRNYLRVRGEYSDRPLKTLPVSELPPRTRRILFDNDFRDFPRGTTSAYAENTCYRGADRCDFRNYLRVRGEYPYRGGTFFLSLELPPRTRRIRLAGG